MTCQRTRAELSQRTEFEERDFFRERFSRDELKALVGGRVAEVFSVKSPSIKKLGLDPAMLSDDEKLEWMAKEPRLIRRPFLQVDGQLVVQPKVADLGRILGLL